MPRSAGEASSKAGRERNESLMLSENGADEVMSEEVEEVDIEDTGDCAETMKVSPGNEKDDPVEKDQRANGGNR